MVEIKNSRILKSPWAVSLVESHVIPATRRPKALGRRAKAGIELGEVDRRLLGGDEGSTFISMGGPQAHDHSG
jgi:hypothetical protein